MPPPPGAAAAGCATTLGAPTTAAGTGAATATKWWHDPQLTFGPPVDPELVARRAAATAALGAREGPEVQSAPAGAQLPSAPAGSRPRRGSLYASEGAPSGRLPRSMKRKAAADADEASSGTTGHEHAGPAASPGGTLKVGAPRSAAQQGCTWCCLVSSCSAMERPCLPGSAPRSVGRLLGAPGCCLQLRSAAAQPLQSCALSAVPTLPLSPPRLPPPAAAPGVCARPQRAGRARRRGRGPCRRRPGRERRRAAAGHMQAVKRRRRRASCACGHHSSCQRQ